MWFKTILKWIFHYVLYGQTPPSPSIENSVPTPLPSTLLGAPKRTVLCTVS